MTMRVRQRLVGFTMLELSIVIVIIGLISGLGLAATFGVLESARRAATESKLNEIEKALMNFRLAHDRLPCPGDLALTTTQTGFGLEAENPGACYGGTPAVSSALVDSSILEGSVPVRTLQLPDEFMYDGWGRKFAYGVKANATAYSAFSIIPPNASCGITVRDAAAANRTTGAIYALVSYGANGHGGYSANGSQLLGITSNTDEMQNCHCPGTAGLYPTYDGAYVQKDPTEDPADSTDKFDDIVRFKERWQMLSYDDGHKFTGYRGSHMAVGFNQDAATSPSTYLYKNQCGTWTLDNDLSGMALNPIGQSAVVAYTPGNASVFVYSERGCNLYEIEADGSYTDLGANAVPNCPPYAVVGSLRMSMSNNGYMAMTATSSPYLWLWKVTGTQFYQLRIPTVSPTAPTMVALSRNAEMLAIGTATTINVYKRRGDAFFPLTTQPSGLPASNITGMAFSPDGKYFAMTENTAPPKLYVWRTSNYTFTAITGSPMSIAAGGAYVGFSDPYGLTFSPDSRYLAMSGGADDNTYDNLVVYKVDAADTFSRLTTPEGWANSTAVASTATEVAFSPDASYIAMTTPDVTRPVVLFRRTSPTTYKKVGTLNLGGGTIVVDPNPAAFIAEAGLSVGFYH